MIETTSNAVAGLVAEDPLSGQLIKLTSATCNRKVRQERDLLFIYPGFGYNSGMKVHLTAVINPANNKFCKIKCGMPVIQRTTVSDLQITCFIRNAAGAVVTPGSRKCEI
jgi:hypothetical protein